MRRRLWLIVFLSFIILPATVTSYGQSEAEYVPNQVLIKFKGAASADQIRRANTEVGAIETKGFLGDEKLFRITLPEGMTVSAALSKYTANRDVEYAEPNYIGHFQETVPNDPWFPQQWHLHRPNPTGGINAPDAWDETTGSRDVTVAINDSGCDLTHPDLVDNFWPEIGYDFYHDRPEPRDGLGHGTAVAGVVGAVGNNKLGVTGVMWTAQLMILKIAETGTVPVDAAIEAIDFAWNNGGRVSNNSWGHSTRSQALQESVARAGEAGMLIVAAAGNNNRDNDTFPHYPCNFGAEGSDNVICVTGTRRNDELGFDHNWGLRSVHLGAPGIGVITTELGGGVTSRNGTSFAAPQVTGVIGLVWSKNPSLTYLEVKQIILNNVRRVPSLDGRTVTGGILNAAEAIRNTPTPQ